jgi:hypothetical protein
MNITRFLGIAILSAAPLLCVTKTWKDVALVHLNCSAKVKGSPDAHTRECAIQCAKSGFGIFTADGTLLKLDTQGNQQAITALKALQAGDHLRATVTGERDSETIKVKSLKI